MRHYFIVGSLNIGNNIEEQLLHNKKILKLLKEKTREKHEAKFLESVETSSSFPFDYEWVMAEMTISKVEDVYLARL